MGNSDPQPWAPDPDHGPGEAGERGSSVFEGSDHFEANGTAKADSGVGGPRPGVEYHQGLDDGLSYQVRDVSERGLTETLYEAPRAQ